MNMRGAVNSNTTINNERTISNLGTSNESSNGGFSNVLIGDDSLARERVREVMPNQTSDLKLTSWLPEILCQPTMVLFCVPRFLVSLSLVVSERIVIFLAPPYF